jgi:hypothetical protein
MHENSLRNLSLLKSRLKAKVKIDNSISGVLGKVAA